MIEWIPEERNNDRLETSREKELSKGGRFTGSFHGSDQDQRVEHDGTA